MRDHHPWLMYPVMALYLMSGVETVLTEVIYTVMGDGKIHHIFGESCYSTPCVPALLLLLHTDYCTDYSRYQRRDHGGPAWAQHGNITWVG